MSFNKRTKKKTTQPVAETPPQVDTPDVGEQAPQPPEGEKREYKKRSPAGRKKETLEIEGCDEAVLEAFNKGDKVSSRSVKVSKNFNRYFRAFSTKYGFSHAELLAIGMSEVKAGRYTKSIEDEFEL